MDNKFILIIAVVFIVGFLMGMTTQMILNPNPTSNDEPSGSLDAFLGTWKATEESQNQSNPGTIYYTYEFYSNQTMYLNTTLVNQTDEQSIDTWKDFQITDELLKITLPQSGTIDYSYSFSDDKQQLTLTSQNGVSLTFTKQ